MATKVRVVSQEDFDKWLTEESEVGLLPIAQRGAKIFQTRACASCHNVDSPAVKIGPSLLGRFGKDANVDETQKIAFDENYIRDSVMNPQSHIATGFPKPSPMPSFQGQLSESEVTALIEYLKSLK